MVIFTIPYMAIILCSIGRYWKPFGVLDYFESRTDTMVTSLKNQLIYYQGCVFGVNYAISLCGWNHVIRGLVNLVNLVTLVRVAAQPLEPLTLWRLQQRSKQSLSFYFLYLYYPWPKDFRWLFYTLTITTRGLKKQTSAASYAIPATLKRASVMEEWLAKQRWSKKFDQRRRMCC